MTIYYLLVRGPFKNSKALKDHLENKFADGRRPENAAIVVQDSSDLGPGQADMWRATVDIAPWRINALYAWYAEEDERPVSRAFPQGSLVFFKEAE